MPYWVYLPTETELKDEEKKGMLIVPYNLTAMVRDFLFTFPPHYLRLDSDGRFHMSSGFVGSTMYLDYLKSTFDMLYREGCNGSPKLMNIPMHSRIVESRQIGGTEGIHVICEGA